jgi:protein O-GlcNAc transferase
VAGLVRGPDTEDQGVSAQGDKVQQAKRLLETGRAQEAVTLLQRALQKSPRDAAVCGALSLVLMSTGQLDQGAFYARRALELAPGDPALLTNLGNALGAQGKDDEAAHSFEEALARQPRLVEAHLGMANVRRRQLRVAEAARHALAALELVPRDPHLIALNGSLLMQLGRTGDAAVLVQSALQRKPDLELASLFAHALNYLPGVAPQDTLGAHRFYAGLLASAVPRAKMSYSGSRDPERPLKIGILSPDLRRHSVAFFLEPWLEHADRAHCALFCYSTAAIEDKVTARLRSLPLSWREAAKLDDKAISQRIAADGIDILIETSGLTQGHRMGVMAMKPAPIQVSMIGYPSTTGIARIDYRLVDSLTDPPGSEAYYAEKLLRLDPCFLCYRPPEAAPEPGAPNPAADITFGSFNTAMKIHPELLELWARLLAAVPRSRLVLKALNFDEPVVRDEIRARLNAFGAPTDRVEVLPSSPTLREHLSHYHSIDIALDTFPYCGTTTTLEALWMGVPVITLAGQAHASRVGVTLLTNAGLPELIATSHDDYVGIATALAADRPRLGELRASLRSRVASSALCDAPAYARRLDGALRDIWRRYCQSPA